MEYSYAQYQADKKLLRFRRDAAAPVPAMLPRKLLMAMTKADPADHPAIQAAHDRLLAVAESGNIPEPPAPPQPTPRPTPEPASAPEAAPQAAGELRGATGGPADDAPKTFTPEQLARIKEEREDRAAWQVALAAQKARHARRRAAWPQLAPPFKEPSLPAS